VARTKAKESDLAGMTVVELRQVAKERGVAGAYAMRKEELVKAVAGTAAGKRAGGRTAAKPAGGRAAGKRAGGAAASKPTGGGARRGGSSSKSLRYSQEIRSVDDRPDRPGRSLVTTNHEVIMRWARARGGTPATAPGTEHDGRPGVLRFDFPGYGGRALQPISWDQWFRSFDERGLNFLYQEQTSNGRQSNFFVLENPAREDA
jgi:Rho termination factor, N-terminal domain